MYKVNDIVVYKKYICRIKEIKENHLSGKNYYVMVPIDDDSLKIDVPTEDKLGLIRNVISKEDANNLIDRIAKIDVIQADEKSIESEYKKLFSEDSLENLIKIIKTTYLRNNERLLNKKKISEKDENYFQKAEKQLYNELSISLGMDFEQTRKYIIEYVQKQIS